MPGFPVWDAPALPDPQRRGETESVTIQRGMAFGQGPGIAITSYDPALIVAEQPASAASGGGYLTRGVVNIATEVSLPFLGSPPRADYRVTDAVLRCGDLLIPALSFDLVEGAQVVVSTDLLTHAIAVVAWQIPLFPLRLERSTHQQADSPVS